MIGTSDQSCWLAKAEIIFFFFLLVKFFFFYTAFESVVILVLHKYDDHVYVQNINKPYLGVFRLMKFLAKAEPNSVPEAATWQHLRQGLPAVPDPDWITV